MKTKKKEKEFDAVQMMRQIRDEISMETDGMSFDEMRKYLKFHLKKSKLKSIGQ